MSEIKENKKEQLQVKEKQIKMFVDQACNELKINGYCRIFRKKKYRGQSHTLKEWEGLFKNDRRNN